MKRILAAFLTAALCFCWIPCASAADSVGILRVGLHYGSGVLKSTTISNVDGAGFTIGCYDGRSFQSRGSLSNTKLKVTASGNSVAVTDAGSGAALYTGTESNLALRPNGDQTECQGNHYRGDLVFLASNGQLTVVNYIPLEEYVKGVLPYEMTPSWSIEALKAQAVCARSYALASVNKHQSRYGFDVCNTTDCQVYQGTGRATSQSDSAVDATVGEYLTYNGKLATGYFFSSDGGATEDAVNVWGNEHGYLKGVPDPYEDLDIAANGKWSKTLTPLEISEKMRAAGYSIGAVKSVAITKRTPMDNVNEVTVTDTSGTSVVLRRDACRTVFSLNSLRYSINGDKGNMSGVIPSSSLPSPQPSPSPSSSSSSSNDPASTTETQTTYIDGVSAPGPSPRFAVGVMASVNRAASYLGASYFAAPSQTTYTFAGTGWGHSVGMSQYGAKGMAEQGFDYRSILNYYFTDIEIKK